MLNATLFALLSLAALAVLSVVDATPSGNETVIVQMFQWNWDSIASECTNFLGPNGYGLVQVSPPAEHVTGPQWWTDYQPVSYQIVSKRGNRSQFQNMVTTCHNAGVRIIVDTIFNHMAGSDSGTGVAGSSFTHYVYPGIYQTQDFHHCGLTPGDDIVDFNNRLQVQTCELVNLADLATNTTYVRSRLAQYANDLLSLGADGFRLDASLEIAATDLSAIISQFSTKSSYITQEVTYSSGQEVLPTEYVGNGDVQEFRFVGSLQSAFSGSNGDGIANLRNLPFQGWLPSSSANVFVTNHDTERNGGALTYTSPSNTYTLALIFSLAYPYGTPTILSSYQFSNYDDGAPNNNAGTCTSTGGSNGWLCQHRWPAISAMTKFRNLVGSDPVNNVLTGTNQQLAFGRGSRGFVIINNADSTWTGTFQTSLGAGSYCDVINGGVSSGKCTGLGVTVSSGSFSVTVPSRNAVAFHTAAMGTGSTTPPPSNQNVAVSFVENATTTFGENIFLVGSITQLASWDPSSAIALSTSSSTYPIWTATVNIPRNTTFQYKFIRKETDGSIVWESDPNRQANTTTSSNTLTISTVWR